MILYDPNNPSIRNDVRSSAFDVAKKRVCRLFIINPTYSLPCCVQFSTSKYHVHLQCHVRLTFTNFVSMSHSREAFTLKL